jgi:hypothetical protein
MNASLVVWIDVQETRNDDKHRWVQHALFTSTRCWNGRRRVDLQADVGHVNAIYAQSASCTMGRHLQQGRTFTHGAQDFLLHCPVADRATALGPVAGSQELVVGEIGRSAVVDAGCILSMGAAKAHNTSCLHRMLHVWARGCRSQEAGDRAAIRFDGHSKLLRPLRIASLPALRTAEGSCLADGLADGPGEA